MSVIDNFIAFQNNIQNTFVLFRTWVQNIVRWRLCTAFTNDFGIFLRFFLVCFSGTEIWMPQPSQLYIIQNAICLATDTRNFTNIIPSYANLATTFPWTIPTLPMKNENFTKNLGLGHQEAPYHEQPLPLGFWNFSYDFRPYYFRNRICWLTYMKH